jgi:hypothetical protein
MFGLFGVGLLFLVLFVSFKYYENQANGLIVFAGSRRELDKALNAVGKNIQSMMLSMYSWCRSLIYGVVSSIRARVAKWLRSLAALIDFR